MAVSKKPRRSRPATRAEFAALENQSWSELKRTWHALPEEALVRSGACGAWSIKDVMNHVAAWQEATLHVLPDLLEGRKLPAGQYSITRFNERNYAQDKDRTLAASRRRLSRARRRLLAFLATVPEAQMLDLKSRVGTWVKYATYGHYDEHLAGLQEYRDRLGTR